MANTTKALTTELKDLDVDRVDGVDRPATGRAFALFKSATKTTKEETGPMSEMITKEQFAALMKNYAAVATAADMLVKALRASKSVSKSVAIAANGMAQILGQDAVVVNKAVPTQPYEYSEPDVDKRGPADENIGPNFTPRSMPGSMVGKVQFAVKSVEAAKAAPMIDEEMPAEKKPAAELPAFMKSQAEFDAAVAAAVAKAVPAPVAKAEEKPAATPASKQVMTAEQREVRKGQGYRFGETFENVVFGAQAR